MNLWFWITVAVLVLAFGGAVQAIALASRQRGGRRQVLSRREVRRDRRARALADPAVTSLDLRDRREEADGPGSEATSGSDGADGGGE